MDKMIIASLSIVKDLEKDAFLLVENHRGINKGFINFPGGKQEADEDIVRCAIRETFEETGIVIKDPIEVGCLEFPTKNFCVYVFWSTDFSGVLKFNPAETKAFWHDAQDVPYEKMREDVKDFLPDILAGKYVKRRYVLDDNFHILKVIDL